MFNREKLEITWFNYPNLDPLSGKPQAISVLKEGYDLISKIRPAILSSGTLLGIVRDNKLIPHDTDIDVNILVDTTNPPVGLSFSGFKLIRTMFYEGLPMQYVFEKDDVVFDIEYIYRDLHPDRFVTVHEHGYYLYDPKYFQKFEEIEFEGKKYLAPSPVREYLTHRYGDWETPKTEKGAWQEDATNLVKW